MQKIWQWIRDRKTNTIRKWRSSLVRRSESDDLQKNGKRVAEKTRSALSENGGGDLSDRRGASRSGAHTYYDESDEAAAHLRAQAKLQLIASTLAELRAEQGHSVSDINLPSTSKEREQRDYEQFFDEPRTKNYLDTHTLHFVLVIAYGIEYPLTFLSAAFCELCSALCKARDLNHTVNVVELHRIHPYT
ncbi:hypothetical protein Q1695_009718 [Nippostrongylus brasiliensis]|nr:hypothetical protein Q1695_009718 [Nippostrongylus brasiliensis]